MSSSRLRSILLAKITEYETKDNPVPEKATSTLGRWYASGKALIGADGAEGRERVAKYKNEIPYFIQNEDEYAKTVLLHIAGPTLGSSKKLRERLLEALVEYTEISEMQIKNKVVALSEIDRKTAAAAAGAVGGPSMMVMRDQKKLEFDAKYELVKNVLSDRLTEQKSLAGRDARQMRMAGGDEGL